MENKPKKIKISKKTIILSLIFIILVIVFLQQKNENGVKDKYENVDPKLTQDFINEIVIGKDISKIKGYLDKGCDPNYDMGNKTAFESVFIRYSNDDLNEYFISKGGDIQKFKLEDMYFTSDMFNKLKSIGAKNVTDELVKAKVAEEQQTIGDNAKKEAVLQAYIDDENKKSQEELARSLITNGTSSPTVPKVNGFEVTDLKGENSITGKIKNTIGYKCSSVFVYVNIIDSSGNVIESTIDSINNLEVGKTWVFDAPIINPPTSYTFKITEIKAFK